MELRREPHARTASGQKAVDPKPADAPARAVSTGVPAWAGSPIRVAPPGSPAERAAEAAESGTEAPRRTARTMRTRSSLAADDGAAAQPGVAASGLAASEARVHDGPADRDFVRLLGARAATHGKDVFLGEGESASDPALMRHELAHVDEGGDMVRLRAATWLERRAWLSLYDHYMPRRLIGNYMDDTGKAITLSATDMEGCNPVVDIRRSPAFMQKVAKLASAGGGSEAIAISGWGGARTNGTLGNFTINYKGNVTVRADATWAFVGEMTFYDYWDFDPKGSGSGRPITAEAKVRVAAALLPGKPFHIYSEAASVSQTDTDARAQWGSGAAPKQVGESGAGMADIVTGAEGGAVGGPIGETAHSEAGAQAGEDVK